MVTMLLGAGDCIDCRHPSSVWEKLEGFWKGDDAFTHCQSLFM